MTPLISLSDLLTRTLELYQKHWKTFLKTMLWSFIPALVGIGYIVMAMMLELNNPGPRATPATMIGFFVVILVSIATSLWVHVRLIQTSLDVTDGKAADTSASQAWSRALPLLFWSLAWSIPLMLGYVLFVIPGIWLTVLWMFAAFRLIEGKKPYARGSSKLTSPYWWPIFGRLALLMVILFGLSSAGQLITVVLGIVFAVLGVGGHQIATHGAELSQAAAGLLIILPTYGIAILVQFALQFILIPLKLIYTALLYRSAEQVNQHPTPTTSTNISPS